MWGYQLLSGPGQEPTSLQSPQAVQQASYTFSRKGPKAGNRNHAGSRLPVPENSAESGHTCTLGNARAWTRVQKSKRITVLSLPKAMCISKTTTKKNTHTIFSCRAAQWGLTRALPQQPWAGIWLTSVPRPPAIWPQL